MAIDINRFIPKLQNFINNFELSNEEHQHFLQELRQMSVINRYNALKTTRGTLFTSWTALHQVANNNDQESLLTMCNGFNPHQKYNLVKIQTTDHKRTAVHFAASAGHIQIVRDLLTGLSIDHVMGVLNLADHDGNTALLNAILEDHRSVAKAIVDCVPSGRRQELFNIANCQPITRWLCAGNFYYIVVDCLGLICLFLVCFTASS